MHRGRGARRVDQAGWIDTRRIARERTATRVTPALIELVHTQSSRDRRRSAATGSVRAENWTEHRRLLSPSSPVQLEHDRRCAVRRGR